MENDKTENKIGIGREKEAQEVIETIHKELDYLANLYKYTKDV